MPGAVIADVAFRARERPFMARSRPSRGNCVLNPHPTERPQRPATGCTVRCAPSVRRGSPAWPRWTSR